jgi:hypothetical protein
MITVPSPKLSGTPRFQISAWQASRRARTSQIATVIILFLCGCSSFQAPKRPEVAHYRGSTGDDIASIHLATILIWSWDNVSHDIQPQFAIKPSSPDSAIAVTSQASSQLSLSNTLTLQAALGANAPHSAAPDSATKSDPSSGANKETTGNGSGTTSGSQQNSAGSNNATDGSAKTNAASNSGSAKTNGAGTSGDSTAGSNANVKGNSNRPGGTDTLALSDAITQLQMTNALFQEAGLLNNYTAGLIQRRKYIPYVVRIQLTVLPNHRQEPYDLYLTLKMRIDDSGSVPVVDPLILVPLLVTDSMESTTSSIAENIASQIQAGISAGKVPASAGVDYRNAIDSINSALSNRPNSLFSIGKIDSTSLRIRVGANRFGNDFELEPKTHSISFVALVSRELFQGNYLSRQVNIEATPIFRDALFSDPQSTSSGIQGLQGSTTKDSFVLEAQPAIDSPINPTKEIICPGLQTVVYTESETGTTGTVNGTREWGNRPVVGYLEAQLEDKEIITFVSSITYRDAKGSIPFTFGRISPALGKRHVKQWGTYMWVDKLRTDASFEKDVPYIDCANHIDSVFVPFKPAPVKVAVQKVAEPAKDPKGKVKTTVVAPASTTASKPAPSSPASTK